MNPLYQHCGVTIFEEMSRLAAVHGAINLGQGFPVGLEPAPLIEAAVRAMREDSHQYPSMLGLPALRQAVAAANQRFWGLEIDPEREVLITAGASEALADCFLALLSPGDEVILFEPAYDVYPVAIRAAGGVPVPVRLDPPDWRLPRPRLLEAITPRTRLIVINSPMNPTGTLFEAEDLAFLARVLVENTLIAVCDEVYEHLTFDGRQHQPLMSLPGMRDRCVRIGSAGKTFSVTGWKVGYVTAAPALLTPIARAHQFVTFTVPPMLQSAVACGLGFESGYFSDLAATLQARRDRLAGGLRRLGLEVLPCAGTYFLCVAAGSFGAETDDRALARRLVIEAGVATIPLSAFYLGAGAPAYLRFCFAKDPADLDAAVARIATWLDSRRAGDERG